MRQKNRSIFAAIGLLGALVAMVDSPTAEAGYTGTDPVCVSRTPQLRVHIEPSTASGIVGYFLDGDCGLNVESVEGNWTFVRGSSQGRNIQGWVTNRFLRPASPVRGIDEENEENNVASSKSCRAFANARSVDTRIPVTIRIVNNSGQVRTVMWIDYKGNPVRYKDLDPGESYSQKTFVGHPWMATDGPGNCKEMFHPTATSKYWEIYFNQ